MRQYTSVLKSWLRKYVRHVPYCIVTLSVEVCVHVEASGEGRRQGELGRARTPAAVALKSSPVFSSS